MSEDTRLVNEKKMLKYLSNQLNNTDLRKILKNLEYKVRPLFDLSTTIITTSRNIFIGPNILQNPQTLRNRINQPIGSLLPSFNGGSVTLPTTAGGSITFGTSAIASITILDYTKLTAGGNDTFTINSVVFTATTASSSIATFRAVSDNETTALNLAECINSTNTIWNTVYAEAIGSIVYLRAKVGGTAGNSMPLVYTDNGTTGGASISGATFSGGTDGTPVTLTISNANYRKMFMMLDNTGALTISLGVEGPNIAIAGMPAQSAQTLLIGMYAIYCDGSGNIDPITLTRLFELDEPSFDKKHASLDDLQSDDHNTIYSRNPIITTQSAGTLSITNSVVRDTWYSCDTSSGNITFNLAALSNFSNGFRLMFTKMTTDSNTVTIVADGIELINQANTEVISSVDNTIILIKTGSKWESVNAKINAHINASSAVHGITGSVVGTSDTQTFSNKEFADALLLNEITTPATPASGKYKIYPKLDGLLYGLNDSGVESAFAALDRAEIEKQVNLISNISIVTSVASNAMTVTLKSMDGSDLSASNFATILFRDPTVSSGSQIRRTITSNLSIVIPSGATLGFANAIETPFHVYAIDTGSGIELGVVRTQRMDNDVWSTTAISSSADSNSVFYSTNAQISKPVRLLARVISTQSTAGLWASNASKIQTIGLEQEFVLEKWATNTGSYTTGSTLLYEDIRSSSHNAYDPSTGIFTAPKQGVLKINAKVTLTSTSTSWSQLSIRNSGGTLLSAGPVSTNIASLGSHYVVATYVAKVNQGDTFKVSIGHGIGGSVSVDVSDTIGQYNSVEFIME
jgi:hypothetical protein